MNSIYLQIEKWLVLHFGLETLAVIIRILAFVTVIFVPVFNEVGSRVSPLVVQTGVDMEFYLKSAEKLFDGELNFIHIMDKDYTGCGEITDKTCKFNIDKSLIKIIIDRHRSRAVGSSIAPPIFPILLRTLQYGVENTILLSIISLLFGILFILIWVWYFKTLNLHYGWILVFILIPNSIWFTLVLSTDMLFALIFTAFYFSYFQKTKHFNSIICWLTLAIIASLTRTIGIAILIFIIFDQFFYTKTTKIIKFWRIFGISIVTSFFIILYLPSFIGYLYTSERIHFFGISTTNYSEGLYPELPIWLDYISSWLTLFGAKLLYFLGLRPSFSDIPWYMLLLRSGQGVLLLPGLFYFFVIGNRRELMFVSLYMLPVLLGPAQDRYVLSIQPILFYYGALAYSFFWRRTQRVLPTWQ